MAQNASRTQGVAYNKKGCADTQRASLPQCLLATTLPNADVVVYNNIPNPAIVTGSALARVPLPERSYERLLDLIVRGRIPPGARLIEAEVALRFGVSRTPIRAAVARLAQERYLVTSTTFRRTEFVVSPLYIEGVHELWRIIGALEGLAASLVAQLTRGQRAAIAADMRKLNQRLGKAGGAPLS